MYVLDANTLIYFFKGMGNVAEKLLAVSPKKIGIPSIVLYELETGIAKSKQPGKLMAQLGQLMDQVQLLPFGLAESKHSALIRAKLESEGNPIGPYDVLIAGTALSVKGVLVTRSVSEFQRIQNLQIENWF